MKLNKKQIQAIYLLAIGTSYQDTANEIGVSKQTICNWRKDTDFNEELKKVIKTNFEDLAIVAKDTLLHLMTDEGTSATIRFKACQEVLSRIDFLNYVESGKTDNTLQDIVLTIE